MIKKRSNGLETRNRLLATAASIFAKKGYYETKTADICHMASANIAAVHYHFGSKEKLYVEAWRYAFERSIQAHPPGGNVPKTDPAHKRLSGHVSALIHHIMDPKSIDFDIVHKEMANPTGLLEEVMRRCIEPLHRCLSEYVRALLGKHASEKDVRLCEMSIHTQCFAPLMHERQRRAMRNKGGPPSPPPVGDVDSLIEHVVCFSLAGIRAVRRRAEAAARDGGRR